MDGWKDERVKGHFCTSKCLLWTWVEQSNEVTCIYGTSGTAIQRKPQGIPVSGTKSMTPRLAVQHETTRLTVPAPRHVEAEGLLLRSLCF